MRRRIDYLNRLGIGLSGHFAVALKQFAGTDFYAR